MKDIIKRLMNEFWDNEQAFIPRKSIPQELLDKKPSIVLTGPRRTGKSFTVQEIRKEIKLPLVYLNFEDERLGGFKKSNFDLIFEAYHEMKTANPVFFLDEIHIVDGWELYVRRLSDSGYKVFITGSNSELLSREIAEKLGARFVEITVLPLDFPGFLRFKRFEPKSESIHSKERFTIKRYFDECLNYGSFPEIALLEDQDAKKRTLQTYFELVFFKDLIGRKGLENESALRFIIMKVRENIGRPFTPRSICTAAKNAGLEVGPATVESYLHILEEAFLVASCLPYSKSVMRQEKKKRYIVDNGYLKLFEIKESNGLMLENFVFMELIKRKKMVCYHQGNHECDFVVDGTAIQVAFKLDQNNENREINGILEAMRECSLKTGMIITHDEEKTIEVEGNKIKVIPAWKWAYESEKER